MHTVKIHLEDEEFQPLLDVAREMKIRPEDIAYAGLNRVMMRIDDRETRDEIMHTKISRSSSLPLWAEQARSVHAYESME